MTLPKNITETLEAMIDEHGLPQVVTGLSLICSEKAEHIRHNWQDNLTSRKWDHNAEWLERASHGVWDA